MSFPRQPSVSTTERPPPASMDRQAPRVAPIPLEPDCTLEPDDYDVGAAVGLDEEEPPVMSAAGFPILTSSSSIEACRSEATREFFFRDQNNGDGAKYLAARAQFGMKNMLPANLNMMETKMMMQTAELASSLPKNDVVRLAHCTNTVCEVVKNQTLESLDVKSGVKEHRPWTLLPVTTPFEMRRQMKDGSKDSMMRTIPHVNVTEVGAHAVSLPSECLQDLAGHGFPLDFVPNRDKAATLPEFPVRDIASTAQCRMLFDINECNRPILADFNVWMFEWSDDFEPNTSLTKSSRGGVWVKTVTIGPPGSRTNQLTCTYPIAMGPKTASHEEAELVIRADLLELARPEGVVIYSKMHGGLVRVRAKIFASLQDQPERRGENHLTGGSSDFHRRFGFSFPWQDYGDVLRPCVNCRDVLLDTTQAWVCPECDECTNFAFDLSHPLLQTRGVDGEQEDELLFRHPGLMELDYPMLSDAASLAHEEHVDGNWTALDVEEWLKIHCMKEATRKLLLLHADKCKEHQDVMGDAEASAALRDAVSREKEQHPQLHAPWPHPAVWRRGVHLSQHPDIPLHLLCLGTVKLLMRRTNRWLTKKHKAVPFASQMKGMFESIKELNLSWLPIVPMKVGGKFGGWVSENCLSMSRVLCWFYSPLDATAADQEPWTEPERPMNEWTGDDCKNWLGQRGLNKTGYAAEVRETVTAYRLLPLNDQPPVVEQRGGSVENVQQTIMALDDMMALLMVEQIDDQKYHVELERSIRVFLTRFADMEEHLAKLNALPSWLASFNCLSLLNLPRIVRQFGPIRNLWEGSWVGEGFLRFAKPAVKTGLRKFWQRSTMTSMARMKGLQVLVGAMNDRGCCTMMDSDEEDEGGGLPKVEAGLFKSYKSVREVDHQIRRGNKAISCLVVDDCLGVACLNATPEVKFVPLSIGPYEMTKMGRHYFHFERDQEAECLPLTGKRTQEVGAMLPRPQLVDTEHDHFIPGSYTVVDRSHRHLNREGGLTGVINTSL